MKVNNVMCNTEKNKQKDPHLNNYQTRNVFC